MFSKAALGAVLAIGFGAAGLASAQVESESLDDLSAWGQRYLSVEEYEFPSSLWRNSNDDTLLALMQTVRTSDLSPAERRLLRRTILSPATRPRGAKAEALLAERASLMLALGEARAAAALAPQLEQEAAGLDAESLAVDLELASGQEATACARLDGPVKDGVFWLKLRAVCAVLQDNFSGAQIAIEFAESQGVSDAWMVEAIFAAAGDTPNPPDARYDTGLNIALSAKADLDTQAVEPADDRPDLAAAVAQRPGVPAELRARFAEAAGELGLIEPSARRDILLARLDTPDYDPSSGTERVLRDLNDPLVSDEVRAEGLADIFKRAALSDVAQYRSTAQLFAIELKRLPQNSLTADYAVEYARAALMAGDRDLAQSWMTTLNIEGAAQPDPYEIAVLEAVDIIAGGDASPASLRAVEKRLISTANTTPREQQIVGIFTAWTGLGIPLSPIARDFVSQASDRGTRLSQGQTTSLKAAVQADAIGESALIVLAMTHGEAELLASSDAAIILDALVAIDASDIARELALEVSGFWKEME
jgi:hypothetical protein